MWCTGLIVNYLIKNKVVKRNEEIEGIANIQTRELYDNLIKEGVDKSHARMYKNIASSYMKKGAKWADKTMLDKACEWLENHNDYLRVHDNGRGVRFDMTLCVMDFRKAMEEK